MKLKSIAAVLCMCGMLSAQNNLVPPMGGNPALPGAPSFFHPGDYFRQHFDRPLPQVELQEPVKLSDYVVDGKLVLSLKNYLDLVMANSTDVQISRLSIETSRNAILNSYSAFDPRLTLNFAPNRSTNQTTQSFDSSTGSWSQNRRAYSATYNQTLQTGTQYSVAFNKNITTDTRTSATFTPNLTGSMTFNVTQPLLRNRGGFITKMPIVRARVNFRRSQVNIEDQIMGQVQTAENAYWQVVSAREQVKVAENGLALQQSQLDQNTKELELGAISELEIYQPQQNYAAAEIRLTQQRYNLQTREDALRRQMGADLDPRYYDMPIVLTEEATPPTDNTPLDREALVKLALSKRLDLQSSRMNLDLDDLSIASARNGLLPDLQLTGSYGFNGTAGDQYSVDKLTGVRTLVNSSGYGSVLNQMFGQDFTSASFGLRLTLPFRDRAAEATMADAMVSKKQNALRVRQAEQQARLSVLNAITNVENARASYKLSLGARDTAQKRADAEKQRYELGVSQLFVLLDAQSQLTNAESALVSASISYQTAQLDLLRQTGQLLDARNIVVDIQ